MTGGPKLIPKPTEDTITTLLKEELEKRGCVAEPFKPVNTPKGLRKPDLVCRSGGCYCAEAKFREEDFVKAIAKVYDEYIKHHRVLGLRGCFVLLYPRELSRSVPEEVVRDLAYKLKFKVAALFAPGDERPFTVFEGTLPEVSEFIAEHVRGALRVEPNIQYITKALRDAATYLVSGLSPSPGTAREHLRG